MIRHEDTSNHLERTAEDVCPYRVRQRQFVFHNPSTRREQAPALQCHFSLFTFHLNPPALQMYRLDPQKRNRREALRLRGLPRRPSGHPDRGQPPAAVTPGVITYLAMPCRSERKAQRKTVAKRRKRVIGDNFIIKHRYLNIRFLCNVHRKRLTFLLYVTIRHRLMIL